MSFIGTRENGWTNAEKHAGTLRQTWACGKKKFQNFSLSKVIEKIFLILQYKNCLYSENNSKLFFFGKKCKFLNF